MGVSVREDKKGSGIYYVYIKHQGQCKAKRVGDKEVAEALKQKIEAALALGLDVYQAQEEAKRKAEIPTLNEYWESFKKGYLNGVAIAPSTEENYLDNFRNHILPLMGDKPLNEIGRDLARKLITDLSEKNLAKDTIRGILANLSFVFNHAIEEGFQLMNPAVKLGRFYREAPTRHDEIDPLTAEEVPLFLKVIWEDKLWREHYPLFLCAVHTGMRIGELAALEWGDVDFHGRFLTVRRSFSKGRLRERTKTRRRRKVDISDELLMVLSDLRRRRKEESLAKGQWAEWVFANQEGNRVDMDNIRRRVFNKALAKAGLRRLRLHDLRHTFASLLIQNGESLAYVRDQLGHTSIKTTVDIYGHLVPGANREAVNRLPSLGLVFERKSGKPAASEPISELKVNFKNSP